MEWHAVSLVPQSQESCSSNRSNTGVLYLLSSFSIISTLVHSPDRKLHHQLHSLPLPLSPQSLFIQQQSTVITTWGRLSHSSVWRPRTVHRALRENSVLACRALDVWLPCPPSPYLCAYLSPTRSSTPLPEDICSYCSQCQNVLALDSCKARSLPFLLDSAQGDHLWSLFALAWLYLLHLPCFLFHYHIEDHVIYSIFAASLSLIYFP